MSDYLILVNNIELVRVSPERVVHIYSDGNYSTMVLTGNDEHLFTFNLGTFEKIIEQQLGAEARTFIRLGKSLIINVKYIYYINVSKQQLILSDNSFPYKFTLSASKEALKALKMVLEENVKSKKSDI